LSSKILKSVFSKAGTKLVAAVEDREEDVDEVDGDDDGLSTLLRRLLTGCTGFAPEKRVSAWERLGIAGHGP